MPIPDIGRLSSKDATELKWRSRVTRDICKLEECHWLENAPETFQLVINIKLSAVEWMSNQVYNDHIVGILEERQQPHVALITSIFKSLRSRGHTQVNRCSYFSENINYLGYTIQAGRLELSNAVILVASERKNHTTQSVTSSLLSCCSILRNFFKLPKSGGTIEQEATKRPHDATFLF